MRLLAVLFALLLTTVLPALDLSADQLKEIAKAAKDLPVGQSSSMVITVNGQRVVVAISAIQGATAVVIGDQVYSFSSSADGSFSLGQTGQAPVSYAASGAKTEVQSTTVVAEADLTTAQKTSIASAQSMFSVATSALAPANLSPAVSAALSATNATLTLQISNGTILSVAQ